MIDKFGVEVSPVDDDLLQITIHFLNLMGGRIEILEETIDNLPVGNALCFKRITDLHGRTVIAIEAHGPDGPCQHQEGV